MLRKKPTTRLGLFEGVVGMYDENGLIIRSAIFKNDEEISLPRVRNILIHYLQTTTVKMDDGYTKKKSSRKLRLYVDYNMKLQPAKCLAIVLDMCHYYGIEVDLYFREFDYEKNMEVWVKHETSFSPRIFKDEEEHSNESKIFDKSKNV